MVSRSDFGARLATVEMGLPARCPGAARHHHARTVLFYSVLITVFVPFALVSLGLSAFGFGVTLAAAGAGGLLGSLVSTRAACVGVQVVRRREQGVEAIVDLRLPGGPHLMVLALNNESGRLQKHKPAVEHSKPPLPDKRDRHLGAAPSGGRS